MASLLNEVKKTQKFFKNLTDIELLTAGICIGISKVSPEIVLKFLDSCIPQLKRPSNKSEFLIFVIQGQLGKAKSFMEKVKESKDLNIREISEVVEVNEIHQLEDFKVRQSHLVQNPCGICHTEMQTDQIECFDDCKDAFHRNCIKTYLEQKLINTYPIKCPSCHAQLKSNSIQSKVARSDLLTIFIQKELADAIGQSRVSLDISSNYFDCPVSGCKNKIQINSQLKHFCSLCKNSICIKCKVKYHENQSCSQYQNNLKPGQNRMQKFLYMKELDASLLGCPECGKNIQFCRHKKK